MRRLLIASALAALTVLALGRSTLGARQVQADQGLTIVQRSESGLAAFAAARGEGILLPAAESDPAEARASAFVDLYGQSFGLQGRSQVRLARPPRRDALGLEHVRFQQMHLGVPVAGGELIVHLRGARAMGANGRIADRMPADVQPGIEPDAALDVARQVIARHEPRAAGARYTAPRLEIVSPSFLEHKADGPASLAWFVEASGPGLRRFIWVDAKTGGLLLQFSQLATALSRQVYDANSGPPPGTLARSEGDGPTGNTEVDFAYDLMGAAYNYFLNTFGRDSYNGAGAPLISSVNAFDFPGPVAGLTEFPVCASWTGTTMTFCPGFVAADDIVGHEITHGIIEHEANLYYLGQSGALNESFADIFGETFDLLTFAPPGFDSPFERWRIGEDLFSQGGPFRDMQFASPRKVSDIAICETAIDNGEVHRNSAIPNHAYVLMVDGGTYNGQVITGIGLDKASRIQYRALTTYLTSSSGFFDNFSALNQSCADLTGTAGITGVDCAQVEKALRAVEMHGSMSCVEPSMSDIPSMCPAGGSPNYLFNNDFEAPVTQWTTSSTTTTQWAPQTFHVDEGAQAMIGPNRIGTHDHRIAMNANIGGAPLPAGTRAVFRHMPQFDGGFDGAAVEYSTNNGTSWINANPFVDGGLRPDVTIADGSSPFLNRTVFSKPPYGYRTTRLTLASLAGQNVRLRFRVASGVGVGPDELTTGWFLDRVAVYTCPVVAGAPTISAQPLPQLTGPGSTANFSVTATSSPPGTLRYQWLRNGVPIPGATSSTLAVTNVQVTSQGYYSVIVSNDVGTATSDGALLTFNIIAFTGPVFRTQPISRTVTVGQDAQFLADVYSSSGQVTFQWQLSTTGAGGPWSPVPNAPPYGNPAFPWLDITGATIGLNGAWFRLAATDSTGTNASNPVVLNVLPANLVTNGTFATGNTTGWAYFDSPAGTGQQQVSGGVFEWNRPAGTGQSVIFQNTGAAVSGTPLAAQFDLGNSANIRQRVSVLMIDADFSDITVCTFWLAPGAPMRTYRMRTHTTKAWTNAAIYFYAATTASFAVNGGYLRLDNVSMNYNPEGSDLRTECVDPTAPAPSGGADSATLLTNGDFGAGTTGWATFGVITSQVTNGVFEYIRPSPGPATPAGVIFQQTGAAVAADEFLTATFDLGNSSAARKRVTVLILSNDFSDLSACTFWLPAGLPLSTYQMKTRATKAWAAGAATGAALYFYAATVGSDRWIRVDNVALKRTPSAGVIGTECIEPVEVLKPPAFSAAAHGLSAPGAIDPAATVRSAASAGRFALPPSFGGSALADGVTAVLVSTDGVTWETLEEIPPAESWTEVDVDLSEYAGQVIDIQIVRRSAAGVSVVWRLTGVRVKEKN